MSFKFKLGAQMGALRDVAPFPCPLGSGATFRIRRAGCKVVRDRRQRRLQSDPVQQVQLSVLLTSDDVAALLQEKPKQLPAAAGEVPTEAPIEASAEKDQERETLMRVSRAATREALRSGLLTPAQVTERVLNQGRENLEEALDLIEGWEGLPGEDGLVPFSEEAARELLELDGEVPDGHEFASHTTGEAFRLYFVACSQKLEAFRGEVIEAAAKN